MEFFKRLFTKKFLITFIVIGSIVALIFVGDGMPDEIKPGDGFSQSSIGIDIQANSDIWVTPGVSISEDLEEFKFYVNGSIFLCSGTVPKHGCISTPCPKGISTCQSSKPCPFEPVNYESKIIEVDANNPNYTPTGIRASIGDLLQFKLIPTEKQIANCGSIDDNLFAMDQDGTFFNKDGKELKRVDVCNGADLYDSSKKLIQSGNSYIGSSHKRIISNANDHNGNKWMRYNGVWFDGSFADLRLGKIPTNEKIEKFKNPPNNCQQGNFTQIFKKYESEIINSTCATFARDGGGVYSYNKPRNGDQPKFDSNNMVIEVAEGLIAALNPDRTMSAGVSANSKTECFPKSIGSSNCKSGADFSSATNLENNSLRLGYPYMVTTADLYNQPLFLAIVDNFNGGASQSSNKGGYNVEVMHSCARSNGQDLYMYIGETPPPGTLKPGDPGTIHIEYQQNGVYKLDNSAKNKGKLYFMIKDNMDRPTGTGDAYYGNNIGHYHLAFSVNASPTWISEIADRIVGPLRTVIFSRQTSMATGNILNAGASFDLYTGILDSGLRKAVRSIILIYVVVVAIGFTLGIIELKTNDIFMILMKIGIISILLTSGSWNFLHKYFLDIFWYGPDFLINKFTTFYNEHDIARMKYNASFGFLNKTLGTVFQWENIAKWLSLIPYSLTNPISLFIFTITFWAFMDMIKGSIKGIILYCVCIVINGFLIGLAPIFFCFILFKTTFRFFDTWVKQLIGNMMTVVLFFITVGLFNEILYNLIYQIFNFGAYKECMLPIAIGSFKVCLINFPMPVVNSLIMNASASNGTASAEAIAQLLPMSIPTVIVFYIFSKLYHIMIDITNVLPSQIFGGSMMYNALNVADSAAQGALSSIGMDDASIKRRKDATKDLKKKAKRNKPKHEDHSPGGGVSVRPGKPEDATGGGSGNASGGGTPATGSAAVRPSSGGTSQSPINASSSSAEPRIAPEDSQQQKTSEFEAKNVDLSLGGGKDSFNMYAGEGKDKMQDPFAELKQNPYEEALSVDLVEPDKPIDIYGDGDKHSRNANLSDDGYSSGDDENNKSGRR